MASALHSVLEAEVSLPTEESSLDEAASSFDGAGVVISAGVVIGAAADVDERMAAASRKAFGSE